MSVAARIYHPEKSVIADSAEIGDGCTIHAPVWIGPGVRIGARTRVQAFAFIPEGVTIGDDCFIGPGATFTNDKYPPSARASWRSTVLGDRVVIGANATILPGVTIGADVLVGAGAVVTRTILGPATVFGNPAR